MSIDKKVFNVEKNITATGGSATDVMKNIPSLAVDVDGDILLRGKETTLLIDGKPATLLGGDVAAALQSLPAASIQSIEVITNPSARYDAQGMSGIINIITKKDNRFGANGSLTLGAGTRDKYNGSLNLNMKNDKWNVFLNSSLRRNRNYSRTSNERRSADDLMQTASYEDNIRLHGGFFNTVGAEYAIDQRNTITLTQNINLMQWGNEGTTRFQTYASGIADSFQARASDNLGGPLSLSTSIDYKRRYAKPKKELSSNITFARTNVRRTQEFITNQYNATGDEIWGPVTQKADGGGSSTSLNGQVDFTSPFFSKEGKLDAGAKTQLFWFESNNNALVDSGDGAGWRRDAVLQNDFNYSQQIHAGYVSFSDVKGKIGYQAGLRLEYSHYEGTSSLLPDTVDGYSNEFLSLFPSAYLSYKLPAEQTLYLSYTRRTNRPSFFQMMPYVDVSNPMDISRGNPDLVPEFIHNTELNYNRQFRKGHQFIASAYYQYTQNLIDRIRTFQDSTAIAVSMPQNLNHGVTYGTELTGKFQLLPVWDATVNVNYFRNEIHGGDATQLLNNSGSSWFTKLNSNVKLPAGFSLQLSGAYEAPKVAAQGKVLEVYWVDAAVRKNLWNNKANIVLSVSDIFNTRKYTNLYEFPNATQTIYRDRETRIANISFTYRFGKSDLKSGSRRSREGSQMPARERDNIKQGEDQGGF